MAIHEECGVFGVMSTKKENVAGIVYYGLYALQHRGQESCGIVVNDDGVFSSYKDLGLVSEVFSKETLSNLPEGSMKISLPLPPAITRKQFPTAMVVPVFLMVWFISRNWKAHGILVFYRRMEQKEFILQSLIWSSFAGIVKAKCMGMHTVIRISINC